MYDELVKNLRFHADPGEKCTRDTCPYYDEVSCSAVLAKDAADAIEDLITALTASNEVIAKNKPKWIPVTERLPNVGEKVLVLAYANDVLTARMRKQTENGYPVFECNGIFLEMAKPGRITHWMPLPSTERLNGG